MMTPRMLQFKKVEAYLATSVEPHSLLALLDLKQNDTEVLYITTPASFKKYDDLGTWKNSATPVEYKGWSADEEIFFSIKNKANKANSNKTTKII